MKQQRSLNYAYLADWEGFFLAVRDAADEADEDE
jgi:hypothetical protein